MIDHLGLAVTDLERAARFYEQALAPIGYQLLMRFPGAIGFGPPGKPEFWLGGPAPTTTSVHVAFRVPTRKLVDAFYAAAIAAGGTDNGPPGVRAMYHPDYYGAFVRDPDGHNIEAVCHEPYLG